MLKKTSTWYFLIGFMALCSCSPKHTAHLQNRYEHFGTIKGAAQTDDKQISTELNSSSQKESFSSPVISSAVISEEKTGEHRLSRVKTEPVKERKLSQAEKKQIKNEIKEIIQKTKKNETEVNTVLLVILAVLLPPLAVALVDGITGPFWLSILLTLLLYLPGLIYALYRIFRQG